MSIHKELGRLGGSIVARGLCSRPGAALIVAASLTLAGGAARYLGQPAVQATPRAPIADTGQVASCGVHELDVAYLPEPNQLYCLP